MHASAAELCNGAIANWDTDFEFHRVVRHVCCFRVTSAKSSNRIFTAEENKGLYLLVRRYDFSCVFVPLKPPSVNS
jgi:hypothetical protein